MMGTHTDIAYQPKAKNSSAKCFVLVLLALAILSYLVTYFIPLYHGLFRLGTVLLLVVAIFVAYKYLLTSYTYSIFTDGGRTPPMLLVEQRQGTRSSLVCRVPLSAVLSIAPYSGGRYPARCYVFTATMLRGSYQLLHVRENGRDFCVKLEADEPFLVALMARVAEEHE